MTATIALPRQTHSDWLARLRTIMTTALPAIKPPYSARERWQAAYSLWRRGRWILEAGQSPADMALDTLRMAFAPPFQRPFPATFDRRAAAAEAVPWWLAGGAPTPVAVYQPKGAATLAASYVNLVTPGTYDAAPGTAPTHNTATGWTFASLSSQYLTTGIAVGTARDWAMLVRFSSVTLVTNSVFAGAIMIAGGNPRFTLGLEGAGFPRLYGNGGYLGTGTQAAAAVMAMAATKGYWNGSQESGSISSVAGDISIGIDIGRRRRSDGAHDLYFSGSIQAIAIWNTSTNHATWMPAVSAAVALI